MIWQEANYDKSNFLFSKNTKHCDKKIALETTGFKETRPNAVYLGNTLVMGKKKKNSLLTLWKG